MSTWICDLKSRLRGVAVFGLLGLTLAGCGDGFDPVSRAGGSSLSSGLDALAPVPAVRLDAGHITLRGPEGFCVDHVASHADFVLFGNCAALGGHGRMVAPGVILTASVRAAGPVASVSPEELRQFFLSDAGRASLANDNTAHRVTLRDSGIARNALWLRLRDASLPGNLSPDLWRAIFVLRGHLVSATVLSAHDAPLDRSAGQALMTEFVARIRQATGPVARRATG
ncbi:MAG: hypothetical protein ABNH26_03570 [Celeribacter sp.]|jgi:hypothetical protein